MSALYLSISANERDLEIEDDLARGTQRQVLHFILMLTFRSPEDTARSQNQDFFSIEKELRTGEGC